MMKYDELSSAETATAITPTTSSVRERFLVTRHAVEKSNSFAIARTDFFDVLLNDHEQQSEQ